MPPPVLKWIDLPRPILRSGSRTPLVMVNGLAEQAESWFANKRQLSRRFDVRTPEILAYDSDALHRWIEAGNEVTVDYLAGRLADFLEGPHLASTPHLVASSLGCQVALTYAVANPTKVGRMVLLCPSGFHGDENLPMIDGVRRSRYDSLVNSAFHKPRFADDRLIAAFERKFQDRRWKKGVLKTLRGTIGHSVVDLLPRVVNPTLVIWGADDQVLSDVPGSIVAAKRIPGVRQAVVSSCGHAPQIEKARIVNQLIARFINDRLGPFPRSLDANRFLAAREAAPLLRSPS